MNKYSEYFGFKKEPFTNELPTKNLLQLPNMLGVKERMDYVLNLGGIMVVTGDVGSGKSSSLRWSLDQYHPSQVKILNVVSTGGSINEFYKQICWAFDIEVRTASRAALLSKFKNALRDLVASQKQQVILVVDEANLLRAEVFSEIHTLTNFENDSKNLISIVFAGQANLIDRLTYRSSAPLASRVIAKTHLDAIDRDQMEEYVSHHLKVAGIKKSLFSESAITALYQGSGGILRKANSLAKGGLMAAAIDGEQTVSAENIRIASTELI